ncbi:MAG: hypothetical protein H6722_07195 [Sandaracinus sp.]|nr:hypothetical protein [Sandaracinus sp.]MCB9612221.1 hypothetical protein [Sandaracinus sp.]MCB9618355.1 hypothetical protein [Sandaracinus sp.]
MATTKKTTRKTTAKTPSKRSKSQAPEAPATTQDVQDDVETEADAATGSAKVAAEILGAPDAPARVTEMAEQLLDDRATVSTKAARVLHEIVQAQPELLGPHVDKLAKGITSSNKRVVQLAADALPAVAKIAPARVAKHLELLKRSFEPAIDVGRDGLVRTFANLCIASVAYQKRLEPVLTLALQGADGKTLQRWSEIVLPALKGEPHARARAVVEDRLDRIPRRYATEIATALGIRLRVRY